ncbi:MAG: hypothetical protein VW577_06400 [Pelagibacteraceae bacterium]
MKKYTVVQEIYTDDSLDDPIDTEHVSESDCLRDAIEDVLGGSGGAEAIELRNDCNYRVLTVYYGYDELTGDWENRDLIFNTDVSIHSRKRIAKLLGA